MSVSVELRTVKLRELGYWQTFFHKNALMYVHGHAGTDSVQVGVTHGITKDNGLEKLAGDDLVPFKFIPGDELVQHVIARWSV